MEEFVTEEEEPWYDQHDLEQGKSERERESERTQHNTTLPRGRRADGCARGSGESFATVQL